MLGQGVNALCWRLGDVRAAGVQSRSVFLCRFLQHPHSQDVRCYFPSHPRPSWNRLLPTQRAIIPSNIFSAILFLLSWNFTGTNARSFSLSCEFVIFHLFRLDDFYRFILKFMLSSLISILPNGCSPSLKYQLLYFSVLKFQFVTYIVLFINSISTSNSGFSMIVCSSIFRIAT